MTRGIVEETLAKLGIPMEELGKPLVRKQIAAGAKAGEGKIQDRFEMYSFAHVQRTINDLPIFQSDVKVAVNNYGEIQRLSLEWPKFELNTEARLREREEVLRSAVQQILEQDPDSELTINSNLAYAKVGGEDEFKPVAVIMVNSAPTPYQLLVELSELASGGDK